MANIAIFRINYKSDFILTLNSDAGWLTPFCIKFWTGAPSQAYFASYDGTTYTHCAPVAGEPTKLQVQFDDHGLPIGDLKYQIGYHFTIADFPTSVEDEVLNQASVIIEVDDAPAQVMLDLNGETAPEIEFSLPAYANEAQRIEREQIRQEHEEQRIANETGRVTEFAEIKTEAVAATNAANAAATLANDKAALAQQKAEYAQAQGDYAKAQGDYAKAQGDTALADHERAEADHTTAASDHTTAASDHTQAGQDHTTAAADHTQADSDHTRAESDHTRAESDHAAVEVYVDSLGAFDISAYHATGGVLAKYANLTAALGNNGENIPDALRKGGMSVKFVQSSDNKYVQYRLMAKEWSTDTDDWAIADESVYIKNPEFIYVKTDKDNKILWAIKTDGGIYYGAGVPQQVIDYIEEKIAELSLDEYEDIVAFLNDLEKGDKTLQDLLNEKVDKEEGKSLIDSGYASSQSSIDNPEYLQVTTDSEDKILEGIKTDGTKVIGGDAQIGGNTTINGDATILGNVDIQGVTYTLQENPEWIEVLTDAQDRIIAGVRKDGSVYIGELEIPASLQSVIDALTAENALLDERLQALESIISVTQNPEFIQVTTDSEGKILQSRNLEGVNKEYVGTETPKISIDGATIENIQDPEGRTEIKTDSEGKILSYRDKEGVLHENKIKAVRVDANNLDSIEEITNETIYVERPKFAEMWFDGVMPTDSSDERTPTKLTVAFKVNGRTLFRCPCTLAIQGQGSATLKKKNYTFEPLNASGDALSIKMGDLIETDSFHLKAYYLDNLQCIELGGYRLHAAMMKELDYPYSKVNNIPIELSNSFDKDLIDIADAKYIPDGFPVVLYLNNDFYGLYTFKLKKTRQNYAMQKSIKSMIFLDAAKANDVPCYLNLPFDYRAWDMKNPKIKGYEEGYPITDATVLANIERLFSFTSDLKNQYALHSEYIVLPHWICFLIFEEVICNPDCESGNFNLLTWDATHWSIIPWDIDYSFKMVGGTILINQNNFSITGVFWRTFKDVYESEIKALYTSMRKSGFLTVTNIIQYYKDVCSSIPRDYYKSDNQKWGKYTTNGFFTINIIEEAIKNKIAFLDTQWLIESNN